MSEQLEPDVLKPLNNRFMRFFKSKGILSTMLGILFAGSINLKVIMDFWDNSYPTDQTQATIIAIIAFTMNVIGWGWVMLPSVIKLKAKMLEFTIED